MGSSSAGRVEVASLSTAGADRPEKFYEYAAAGIVMDYWVGQGKVSLRMAGSSSRGRRRAPVAELFPPQGQWTEEDYFALPDTNRYVELYDGELVMPPHPTFRHQEALKRLFIRLNAFVEGHGLGVVQIAPLPVRLWPGKIREPDVFFIAKEHTDRIGEHVSGVPDLLVEVTSPSTARLDRMEKFAEYARAGVPEYWVVDSVRYRPVKKYGR
jgi:Uma2 family endonuclease